MTKTDHLMGFELHNQRKEGVTRDPDYLSSVERLADYSLNHLDCHQIKLHGLANFAAPAAIDRHSLSSTMLVQYHCRYLELCREHFPNLNLTQMEIISER